MKIGVIGAGKWGQALHFSFLENHDSYIYSRTKRDIKNFVTLDEILETEYLVFALSAQHAREWMEKNFKYTNQKILVASKGIEAKSGKFLNDIFAEFLPRDSLAFISGPSFASEVIKRLPTALVISSTDEKLAKKFSSFFPSFIKTYVDDDVIGAEIAGAYKNVLAIASGICDGLKLGNNARASLISRGLVEMSRFAETFGAKKDTFLGLSGAGDLFLTASSELSRNYRVGKYLAQNESLEEILVKLGEVAEGVATSKAIYKISKEKEIYTPIANEVYKIINGKSASESLKDLLKK
ncbi:MAG: NAD(P)H-dependent glycerol-3-phosphate dehydrogenase [Epsilonproteobacteria bacterium]|nr:NAD(P)H-dependent glycerol-3-phosphate dehydrogenase [Campylobacterota bacterium]